ncbi:hypothetical protein ACFLY2_00170 [Patescibacteria group bacterium]
MSSYFIFYILRKIALEHTKEIVYDLILYVPPEIVIEDDGTRHIDLEFQKLIDERIKRNLDWYTKINKNVRIEKIS